jgi:hypothetical protein
MLLPPPCLEASFLEFLKDLPEDCLGMAREFKAFTRGRKVKTPAELLQLAMIYCGLDAALREAAGDFALLRERITDTAVRKRLMACGPWLRAVLRKMMPGLAAPAVAFRLLAVDSTSLTGIAPDGVAFRVHLVLDLVGLTLHEAHAAGVEEAEGLGRHPFVAGDVVLADRGYSHPASILELAGRQVRVVVRLNPVAMPLYERQEGETAFDPARDRLDLAAHLRGVAGGQASLAVWLRGGKRAGSGWVHARRLPPEAAEAARRRCRRNAQAKGRTPGADTLYLAGWMLAFTTVPPGELDADTVLELYRTRWQVELVFKRLKSLLDLDALRTRPKSVLGEVWVHGKLLYALVVEKRLGRSLGQDWRRMDRPREATPWRLLKMIRGQVDARILEAHRWKPENWPACFEVVKERPRRRKLQTLPAQVVRLKEAYQTQGAASLAA